MIAIEIGHQRPMYSRGAVGFWAVGCVGAIRVLSYTFQAAEWALLAVCCSRAGLLCVFLWGANLSSMPAADLVKEHATTGHRFEN